MLYIFYDLEEQTSNLIGKHNHSFRTPTYISRVATVLSAFKLKERFSLKGRISLAMPQTYLTMKRTGCTGGCRFCLSIRYVFTDKSTELMRMKFSE